MIIFDIEKAYKLRAERNIDIDEIIEIIVKRKYIKIMQNPKREGQQIFILSYKDYIHIVPFVIDNLDNIIIKTVFPSRSFHKVYGKEMK